MKRTKPSPNWEKWWIRIWKCHWLVIIKRCLTPSISSFTTLTISSCTTSDLTLTDPMLSTLRYPPTSCQLKMKKEGYFWLEEVSLVKQPRAVMSLWKSVLSREETCCLRGEHIRWLASWWRNRNLRYLLLDHLYLLKVWISARYMTSLRIHGPRLLIWIREEISIRH